MQTLLRTIALTAGLVAAAVPPLHAAPGDLDATFGNGGMVVTPIGSGHESGESVAVQSDGKIVMAGGASNGSPREIAVVRYTANGSLDTSFGGTGKVTTTVGSGSVHGTAVRVQGDGKILVAGYTYHDESYDLVLVRYNASGNLDMNFGIGGKVTTGLIGNSADTAKSMAVQSDGKIVVAGFSYIPDAIEQADFAVVRYTSTGALDTSFNGTGKVITDIGSTEEAYSVAVQGDGRILVAGYTSGAFAIVRYNANGSLDTSFGGTGKVITRISGGASYGRSVAVQVDGKIIVAGELSGESKIDFALVRYNADGSLDTGFGGSGEVTMVIGISSAGASSVAVQGDGKILVSGHSWSGSSSEMVLVRCNANGTLDPSFGSGGKVTAPISGGGDRSIAVQGNGKILVAGSTIYGRDHDFALLRYEGGATTPTVPTVPTVATGEASGITATGAALHGTVNPNGEATTVQFEYGTTTRYGLTASVTLSPNSGTTAQAVSATISGLMPNTTYHYRLSASNSAGASNSGDMTFTTARLVSHVVASSGGAAAGAGLPEDATFFSFTAPDVGVSGGKVLIPGGKKLDAIFDEQGEVLLRDEQMVPVDSAGGAEMGRITRLQVPTGDAVLATLERSSGTTAKNDQVLFTGLQSGTPTPAVRKGQEVPGLPGIQLKSFLSVDGNGETTFFSGKLRGAGVTGANDMAIFAVGPDGFRLLVRTGMTVEDQPVKSIATLLGEAKTLSEGRWRSGESLGVRLSFQDKKQGLYLISGNASGPEDWLRITRTDDDAGPDLPGAKLEKFNFPAYGPGAAVVDALLRISEGGITKQDKSVVFEALGMETKDLISLQWLAQSSAQVPSPTADEVTGSAVTRLHTVLAGFGRASTVIADVTLPEERKAQTTIFDARPDGTLRQIARIGGAAPGGGRWASFKSVAKPDGNGYGALILGELAVDKAEGITSDKRTALFAVDSQGNLLRILRSGDEIEFGGPGSEFKTVKSFTALTGAAGSIGAARGYDSEGQVAVLVSFTDRTQAVVVIQIP